VSILEWDFETYIPPKGVTQRSEEIAILASLIHKRLTNPKIGELLEIMKENLDLSSFDKIEERNFILISRDYTRAKRIPEELVKKLAMQEILTVDAWKKAKKKKQFLIFKQEFDKLLELVKERVRCLNPNIEPFDVLLDEYEPGFNSEILSEIFDKVKAGVVPLIQACVNSSIKPDDSLIMRRCPIDIQKKLSDDVIELVQYDLERGRIDETEHPFTTGFYDDVRITTHYFEQNFVSAFYSDLHEAGHGVYEQNLSENYKYQPIGTATSDGMHESQSRFIENYIGRSREFWEYYMPRFKALTGDIFSDITLDDLYHALNQVKPSKIRVDADEVTYSLHVIIRFEIERDLLMGKITTDQLPEIWNQKYKEYLGVDIVNDSEGVLQDIHWACGEFATFPSYVLGNIFGAQMLNKISIEIPNYKDFIRKGELKPIITWLNKKIHEPSNLYDPLELIKHATGEEMNPEYFIRYLNEKYSKIYKFNE
jgi:carboxypeptidase Taq